MLIGTSVIFCLINSMKNKLTEKFFSGLQWPIFSYSYGSVGWPIWLRLAGLSWAAPFHEMGWLDLDVDCRLSLRLICVFLILLIPVDPQHMFILLWISGVQPSAKSHLSPVTKASYVAQSKQVDKGGISACRVEGWEWRSDNHSSNPWWLDSKHSPVG